LSSHSEFVADWMMFYGVQMGTNSRIDLKWQEIIAEFTKNHKLPPKLHNLKKNEDIFALPWDL